MTDTMKACPFCGNFPYYQLSDNDDVYPINIGCRTIGCIAKGGCYTLTQWNRRADTPSQPQQDRAAQVRAAWLEGATWVMENLAAFSLQATEIISKKAALAAKGE